MMIFIWLWLAIATYLYFFRESFFAELAISFLPYILVCCLLASLLLIVLLFFYKYRKNKNKGLNIFFAVCLLIWSLWIWWLYYLEFFSFYNHDETPIRLASEDWVKIFYANILYTNFDFKSLQQKIEAENPDIVILVEFSDAHEEEMKDFFQEHYPYMNRNSRSITLAGDVVFSKLPLKNIENTSLSNEWARNYSYMTLQGEDSVWDVDLYVIHTAAPVSMENFEMRNNQLNMLKSDFQKRNSSNPAMIIGDFNLSPWSYYYSKLIDSWDLKNVLSFQNPNYTWSLFWRKIFRSHIDQLFISDWILVSNVDISDLSWSDHRAFLFYAWINN